MKKRYVVTFLNRVADDQGHEKDVPRHQVDVFAASKKEAFEEAQADFCRRHDCRIGLSMPIARRA